MDSQHVKGLSDLVAAMNGLPDKVRVNGLRRAVSSGAVIVRNDARARAPVDTGEMRKDIQVKRERVPDAYVATYSVHVRSGKRSRLSGRARDVDKDSFYWKFVEFGTAKMAAQPFLRPAFEAKKQEAADKIISTLRERLAELNK